MEKTLLSLHVTRETRITQNTNAEHVLTIDGYIFKMCIVICDLKSLNKRTVLLVKRVRYGYLGI